MPELLDGKCQSCRFWDTEGVRRDLTDWVSIGSCHRHAPVRGTFTGNYEGAIETSSPAWPMVRGGYWCGDYERVTEAQKDA